jgi:hypothetical protein
LLAGAIVGHLLRRQTMQTGGYTLIALGFALVLVTAAAAPPARACSAGGRCARSACTATACTCSPARCTSASGCRYSAVARLAASGTLRVRVIDGPDHTFTPRWSHPLLVDAIAQAVAG